MSVVFYYPAIGSTGVPYDSPVLRVGLPFGYSDAEALVIAREQFKETFDKTDGEMGVLHRIEYGP